MALLSLLARAGAAQGVPHLTLADTALFPEGIARDAARGRWLVSLVRQRTVVALSDAGVVTPFAAPLPADVGAILGIHVDSARGALYAASGALPPMQGYTAADTLRAEVLEFDLASGALRRRITLPDAARQRVPGDLAVGRDGTLYVTDGLAARLYVVPRTGPVRTITSAFLHSPQGVVLLPDERALIVADYRHGLVHVPLVGADTIARITDTQGRRLQGLDGLYWHGDALIATYNGQRPGRVWRITLSPDRRGIASAAVLAEVAGAGEPTLGQVLGDDFFFVSSSPWSAYDDAGARRADVPLWPVEIRRLPLPGR